MRDSGRKLTRRQFTEGILGSGGLLLTSGSGAGAESQRTETEQEFESRSRKLFADHRSFDEEPPILELGGGGADFTHVREYSIVRNRELIHWNSSWDNSDDLFKYDFTLVTTALALVRVGKYDGDSWTDTKPYLISPKIFSGGQSVNIYTNALSDNLPGNLVSVGDATFSLIDLPQLYEFVGYEGVYSKVDEDVDWIKDKDTTLVDNDPEQFDHPELEIPSDSHMGSALALSLAVAAPFSGPLAPVLAGASLAISGALLFENVFGNEKEIKADYRNEPTNYYRRPPTPDGPVNGVFHSVDFELRAPPNTSFFFNIRDSVEQGWTPDWLETPSTNENGWDRSDWTIRALATDPAPGVGNITPPSFVGGDEPYRPVLRPLPTDVDGDGNFMDLSGDGKVTYQDIDIFKEILDAVGSESDLDNYQERVLKYYDYDGDGELTRDDLLLLFEEATSVKPDEPNVDSGDWETGTEGDADALIVGDGALTMRVYRCAHAWASKSLGQQSGMLHISFHYKTKAEEYWEHSYVAVYQDGEEVYYNDDLKADYGTTRVGTFEDTLLVDGNVTVEFGIDPSPYCDNFDHADTFLELRNITLNVDEPLPAIGNTRPHNVDTDNEYEDITGDSKLRFNDLVGYYQHWEEPSMTEHVDAYDYTDDGELDFNDIISLFKQCGSSCGNSNIS